MEEQIASLLRVIVGVIDAIAVIVVVFGVVQAVIGTVRLMVDRRRTEADERTVWLRFARWLVAALTFQLAADIVETTLAPTWDDLGRVAVIAVIRTMLTYFLDRDVEAVRERQKEKA